MTLSPELIEKAAEAAARHDFVSWACISEEGKLNWRRAVLAGITAVLPDIRKEVLEEAAKECEAERVLVEARNDWDAGRGCYKCATRIRSLMEKEE